MHGHDTAQRALGALATRQPAVVIHVAARRGIAVPPVGVRAVYTPDQGLAGTLGDPSLDRAVVAAAPSALAAGEARTLIMAPDGRAASRRDAAYLEVFFDPVIPTPHLVIVGAGHVAQPLAVMAPLLGFRTTVIDDRADYASPERFPSVDTLIAAPIGPALAQLAIDQETYLVLVTRGHRFDEEALRRVLASPAPYVGMIGSRRRVHLVCQKLRSDGFPPDAFRRLYAPIGLDLGARTPAEIALAIAGELVNVRRGGRAPHLSLAELRAGGADRA